MKSSFTEAVSADTTFAESAVKKLRCGDAREDGRLFWSYHPTCANGERWVTPERFAAKKAKRAEKKEKFFAKMASAVTKFRRGFTRQDGKVFWRYNPSYPNGEWWVTPEQFAVEKGRQTDRVAKRRLKLKAKKALSRIRCGTTRSDGKVFWSYDPSYSNGECWVTPEQFAAKKIKKNARVRERRSTDPLFALKCRLYCRVFAALKSKGLKKTSKTESTIGCTFDEFRKHIEGQFLSGMSWSKSRDWHVDHVVPLDAATTEEDVYALNHYTNLRPLWGRENRSKSCKIPAKHELPANLHPRVFEIWKRHAQPT